MSDTEMNQPQSPPDPQQPMLNMNIENALIAVVQQNPDGRKILEKFVSDEQNFQHQQQLALNQAQIETAQVRNEMLKILAQAEVNERNAQANLANTEAEKIRNSDIPKGLAETEQIKSQTALNYERAATMKTDRTQHTTAFIARMVIVAASMGAGVWSFLSHQPYQLTLGFVALALAALVDVQGFVKQLKGKNDDKD